MDPDESLSKYIAGARCGLPGFHNIENATAAAGVVLMLMDQNEASVAHGLETFKGVKRRFEYIVRTENAVVIDDYAHHPGELDAIIGSVRELYPGKTISGIFQPHLFTRTRDFADGFAKSLSQLDDLILMDIYPARELPIPGITSAWLLEQVQNTNKQLLSENEILQWYKQRKPEVLLILGAGDIDRLVPKIKATHDGN